MENEIEIPHGHPTDDQHIKMAYMAWGDDTKAYGDTPRAAALAHLARFPRKRKPFSVQLIQEFRDERGAHRTFHAHSWQNWRQITRANLESLPDIPYPEESRKQYAANMGSGGMLFTLDRGA